MLIFHRLGWISAVAVYAFSFSGSLRTQSQVQTPIVTPLATVSTANPQPSETRAADVTPEDVGDALMLHQRYQAAIEAYQNAAQNSSNSSRMEISCDCDCGCDCEGWVCVGSSVATALQRRLAALALPA